MVPLTVERKLRAETPTAEGLVTVFRAVARTLPASNDSLLDRLFALECMVRAGRKTMAVTQGLLAVRREAELYIEQDWEPDVPHAAVLGQALSVIDVLGEDPSGEWGPRLASTVDKLSQRNSRFGLTSSGPLIAAVVRGLAVVNLPIPSKLLDAIEAYLEASSDPVLIADLAEALARHRSTRQLAKRAAAAAFVPTRQTSAAIAQWWLAERWELLLKEPIAAKASDVEDARLVALSSPNPEGAPLSAMLAEVLGRGIGTLVVIDSSALARVREGLRLRSVVENYSWRVAFLALLAALATAKLRSLVEWLSSELNAGPPSTELLRVTVTLIWLSMGVVIAIAIKATYRRMGRKEPIFLDPVVNLVLPSICALSAFLLYPH